MAPPNAPNDSPEANEFEQGDIAARQSEQDDQYVFPYHYIPIVAHDIGAGDSDTSAESTSCSTHSTKAPSDP